jgi:hypothetical protein
MGVRSIVEDMAGREMKDIHDLFSWMMRRHYGRTLNYWGSRGFAVWMEVMIKNKERFEEEVDSNHYFFRKRQCLYEFCVGKNQTRLKQDSHFTAQRTVTL